MDIPLTAIETPSSTPIGHRILDVAESLFYQHGITATGVDRICHEADTTKRTLYQRFGSKDALVAAYLQRRAHRWQTALLDALTLVAPDDALGVIYHQATQWAGDHRRGCAFVSAWAELGPADTAAVHVIQDEKHWMRALFTHIARWPDRGHLLHLLYEGAQVSASVTHDPEAFTIALTASRNLTRP